MKKKNMTELMVRTYLERKDKDKGKEKKKKLTPVQPQPNKDKTTQNFLASQHFDGGKKEKPARPHNWSSFLKEFLSPVSMGRTPAEQLQRQAMAPHERFRLEAGRRTTWSWRKSIVPPLKSKKPRRSCTMVCGTYQNIWQTSALWKTFALFFFF